MTPQERLKADGNRVGLRNVGNTCYVNSILQTYFMLEPFREMLLALDLHRQAPPSNTQQSPIDSDLAAAIAMSLGEPAPEPATAVPPPSQKQEDPSKEKMVPG